MESPLLASLAHHATADRPAVIDARGPTTHAALAARAAAAAAALGRLDGRRVAVLAPPDADWVAAFLGVLLAGGVAVPLSAVHPPPELAWFADDAGADVAIVGPSLADAARDLVRGRRVLAPAALAGGTPPGTRPPLPAADAIALLVYTSGTTGKPKGAALTHASLGAQTSALVAAWGLAPDDRLLHALPLHHLHGLVVALLATLVAGGAVRLLPRFDPAEVVAALPDATVWMAVPTMYQKLRAHVGDDAAALRPAAGALRLATSGSAALPATAAAWWHDLTGTIPLERFGMTETGIVLSNPLDPAARRRGSVGTALPGVDVRLVADDGAVGDAGELQFRGPGLFAGYWGRDDATRAAFTADGWFRSGDLATRAADGFVRVLGRTSTDILKSGGYKLSALAIEEVLRDHPAIGDVAVVGVPDETWGDRVVAAVVARAPVDPEAIRAWARTRLATYQVPREVVVVDDLPRNAMGKPIKPALVAMLARRHGT